MSEVHQTTASRKLISAAVERTIGVAWTSVADVRTPVRDVGPEDSLAHANERLESRLNAARASDQEAFADIYRDTQPRLYRYAVTLVGRDAEDVTAEAWLQIARDLRRFVGDMQAFRGWAATIVRNRAMDHVRAAARRPVTPVETEFLDRASDSDTAARAIESMTTAAALDLIATLPQEQAEAVLLRAVMGLDATTAGKVLGKRSGAVRVAAHRGLKTLGRLVDQPRSIAEVATPAPPVSGQ